MNQITFSSVDLSTDFQLSTTYEQLHQLEQEDHFVWKDHDFIKILKDTNK